MNTTLNHARLIAACTLAIGLLGCEGTVSLIPSNDLALRKTPSAFAADAAKRQYESGAARAGDTEFRAQYALMLREVDIANISGRDWSNVEVWINGQYVVYCPTFDKKSSKRLDFTMFYDRDGRHFDTQYGKNPIQSIEVFRDGTMYAVVNSVKDIE